MTTDVDKAYWQGYEAGRQAEQDRIKLLDPKLRGLLYILENYDGLTEAFDVHTTQQPTNEPNSIVASVCGKCGEPIIIDRGNSYHVC